MKMNRSIKCLVLSQCRVVQWYRIKLLRSSVNYQSYSVHLIFYEFSFKYNTSYLLKCLLHFILPRYTKYVCAVCVCVGISLRVKCTISY